MSRKPLLQQPSLDPATGLNDAFFLLQKDTAGFEKLARLLRHLAGIHLPTNPKNLSLMASRLHSLIRQRGFSRYGEYHQFLESAPHEARQEFISALTTNTTEFFRESAHFAFLRSELPRLIQSRVQDHSRELRVWCAASSTGQEPYSLLMTLLEAAPELKQWELKFLATDIDLEVLQKAAAGVYREPEVSGIPRPLLQQYFLPRARGAETVFQVKPELRRKITFAPFNLISPSYGFKHSFDVIFCRNVLIYFDKETCMSVVRKLGAQLRPEGLLFLGHSEAGMARIPEIEPVTSAVYRKAGAKQWKI